MILQASSQLREETGVARQPVYEARYQRVVQAVSAAAPHAGQFDHDALVAELLSAAQPAVAVVKGSS